MNIPATIATTAGATTALFALFALGLSGSPGWGALRWFAYSAFAAAGYQLAVLPQCGVGPDAWVVPAARFMLFCAGVHGACWYVLAAALEGRPMGRVDRALVSGGLALAVTALVPGAMLIGPVTTRVAAPLGWAYRDATPTLLGGVCFLYYTLATLALGVRLAVRARRGDAASRAPAVALLCLGSTAAHDTLVGLAIFGGPNLLDVGMGASLAAAAFAISRRFVSGARLIDARARDLEIAQAELVRRERLVALGELSAVIAHEVRNPLAVVFNALASMRRHAGAHAELTPLMAIVQEEAERLNRIVSGLLSFARPQALRLEPVDVARLIASAAEAALAEVGEPEGSIAVDVANDLAGFVCDEQLVREAAINLMTNALRSHGRSRPVAVRAARDDDGALELVVRDDGEGIAAEHAERVFTPFFTTRPSGTGLGLAVVRRVAEDHRGECTYAPTPGGGATFVLRIPSGLGKRRAA